MNWIWWGLFCLGLVARAATAAEPGSGPSEYQVKAVFVFNFVKFTDWPATTFTNGTAPIVIGIVGENPFGAALEEVVKAETISGHPFVLKQFQPGDDLSRCQVLFFSRRIKESLPALLATLKHKPVLTVSDCDAFCEQGGMVNLALAGSGTVHPEINPSAARIAGVQISSKLLNLPTVRLVQTER